MILIIDYLTLKNKFIFIFFSFISLFSCKEKNSIEIYLLNKRKENIHGINTSLSKKYLAKNYKSFIDNKYYEFITVDTINDKIFYADEFNVENKDLLETPFISDSEIKGVDTLNGYIYFNKSASRKIISLVKPHNLLKGTQFVLTVNKNIALKGYFWASKSPQGTDYYTILRLNKDKINEMTKFYFFKGKYTREKYSFDKILFKNFKLLKDALIDSNRIINTHINENN